MNNYIDNNQAIVFDENEFEIAIVTYKRSLFIKTWLDKCYIDTVKRNIQLKIIDSSPDNLTQKVVDEFNLRNKARIAYCHVDTETPIGYKPMIGILTSKSKYVWVAGDSRYHDFKEFDKNVFPFIRQGLDFIVFFNGFGELTYKIYTDKTSFLHDCFIPCTCIGCSIYKVDLFDDIKLDEKLMAHYDNLFKYNYGFGWLGYFYSMFAKKNECRAAFCEVTIYSIAKNKKQAWAKKFYGCWIDDLHQIMNNLPSIYNHTDDVLRETWEKMHLDSWYYCYIARMGGDLNSKSLKYYKENGLLERTGANQLRVEFFAYAPRCILPLFNFVYRAVRKVKHILSQ